MQVTLSNPTAETLPTLVTRLDPLVVDEVFAELELNLAEMDLSQPVSDRNNQGTCAGQSLEQIDQLVATIGK